MAKKLRLSSSLAAECDSDRETIPLHERFAELHDCDSQEAFVLKLLLNSLANFNETYSEYALLNRLVNEPLLDGPWFNAIREHLKEEKEGPLYAVGALRKIITRAEVKQIVHQIRDANPALNGPLRPRETARTLGDLLDLNELEVAILDTACRLPNAPYNLRSNLDGMDLRFNNPAQMIAALYNATSKQAQAAMKGVLFNAGIISKENSCIYGMWGLNSDFSEIFNEPHITVEQIDHAVFPHMLETELKVGDYPHLNKEINRVVDIIEKNQNLKRKKGKRERGVNVMFWGLAGTGKTELAIAMAAERGWNLKVIGDVSRENMEENGRENRLASLKLATKIFRNQPNTVLLFDEMEDLFKSDTKAAFSKAFINRIIETTEIPIIWTTNNLQLLGQPVLRRMVYNIGFKTPPEETRLEIWTKYAKQFKMKVDEDALKEVAKLYPVVPAVIKNAANVAATAMGRKKVDKENLLEIVGSLDTLVNYGAELKVKNEEIAVDEKYDVTCVNSDVPLADFTHKVVNAKDPGFAICLYGAPGTGKSEYGRHLAKQMGKEVLFKRASDLQSMWVGECEKNIAKAFAEAKKKKMVLIIDEGDSFLRDRTKARNSWEISQVNEMLSQMETHTQPFILTTNLMKDLDAASLRRFTFKMEFRYMKPEQARRLFKSFFGVEAPAEMDNNHMLVPGDFANVRKQVRILGIKDGAEIYRLVEEETKLKPGKREAIGFNR